MEDPRGNGTFDLTKAVIYEEPLDRVNGAIDYTNRLITVSGLQAASPAGRLDASGSFAHEPSDFQTGRATVHLATSGLNLNRIQNVQKAKPGVAGTLRLPRTPPRIFANRMRSNKRWLPVWTRMEALQASNGTANRSAM